VLGEMLELGPDGAQVHAELGARARELGVDRLVAVGPGGRPYLTGFPGGATADDVPGALALLRAELEPGDVVLVKASRAIGLDRLAAQLLVDPLGGETFGGPSDAGGAS